MALETRNFTPEEAADRRRQSKQQIIEILKDVPMPYCIGIGKQIKAAHPAIPVKHVSFAMFCLTSDKKYLKAMAAADCRHSLDGSESPLSEEHRQLAAEKVKPKRSNSLSKQSEVEKQVIATPVQDDLTQQEPAQRACIITTKRRRTLTLRSK